MFDRDAHQAEVEAFRARRDARYHSPEGWLTLVERTPLEPGRTELPFGAVIIEAGRAPRVEVAPGAAVTRAGAPLAGTVEIVADEAGVKGDVLHHAGRTYDVFRRDDDHALRVRDPDAPARLAFAGMPVYPIDPRWRVEAELERLAEPRWDEVPHTDGAEGKAPCIGTARFTLEGVAQSLLVYDEVSTQRLYVPFLDPTNREETYGGGRMMYAPIPAPGAPLVLDFNMAFNPPCALNSLVSCPLPPRENRLAVPVRAGEKRP
ncbi:MAG TPA: DUF1684 domain-containing protein [Kofleriaceae bacterium]|nr:DUF1684 domain-containing protein [Kofleriaceae bacterium]